MAVESAGPYASLHLAPDKSSTPAPHHSVFLQAGCPSCRPTNSVKALKARNTLRIGPEFQMQEVGWFAGQVWTCGAGVCSDAGVRLSVASLRRPGRRTVRKLRRRLERRLRDARQPDAVRGALENRQHVPRLARTRRLRAVPRAYHLRSTQPCIPPGSLNRVPASAGVRAGMSPLPGGR